MTNPVYQATVAALETLLPPRVVSRTLQEGLQAVAKTPATVQYGDVNKILKVQVYRQLQASMPVTEAKVKLQEVLEKLKTTHGAPSPEDAHLSQTAALEDLRAGLKPFNLYFEWPEVQKLRAQLHLLKNEQKAGRETSRLLDEARQGLATVEQKLTDLLVYQAKALSELTASLETLESLGGPKIRRLENLIGQIQTSQASRALAPAEVERAQKLVGDRRKPMEPSVVEPPAAPPDEEGLLEAESEADDLLSLEPTQLEPSVGIKLPQFDLDDEHRSLDKLGNDYADLLSYRPALAEELANRAAQLATGISVATDLERLRTDLAEAARAERMALSQEFKGVQEEVKGWEGADLGVTELAQHLQVTLSVLDTALPPPRDVQHLRSLYNLASSRYTTVQRQRDSGDLERETRLAEQLGELHKLEERVSGYGGVPELQSLSGRLQEARAQLEAGEPLNTLDDLWRLLDAVQAQLERRSADFGPRLDAALKTYAEVGKLNSDEAIAVGTLLQHLDSQRGVLKQVSAGVRNELVGTLTEVETRLSDLQAQYDATRAVADELAGSDVLQGLFGLFDAAPSSAPVQAAESRLEDWIADRLATSGVQGVLLFDEAGRVLSGHLPGVADGFYPAIVKLAHSAAELGEELKFGEAGLTVLELSKTALISVDLGSGYRFVALVEVASLDDLLLDLRSRLAELRDLVHP